VLAVVTAGASVLIARSSLDRVRTAAAFTADT
jgi:hypothetical protein